MREEGKEGDGEEETVKEGDDNGGHESKTKGNESKIRENEKIGEPSLCLLMFL